ncbi:MAG: glycosyltransferase [Phycisphaerales bacterium]|nr:glycosyltransferase [Planctomycetota bacterium]MCH8508054.1 glycosyltransferase [Phycisphaerales bacterium]
MRVLHYKPTMRAEEGGVVKAVFDLCVLTASPDLDVGLATYDTDLVRENLPPDAAERIALHRVELPHASTRLLHRADVRALREIIRSYDLLHLHTMWTPSNPQVIRICRELGKPYVLTVHGMLDDWCMAQRRLKKLAYLRTWGRRLLRDAARVHCTAQAETDQAAAWLDRAGFDRGMTRTIPLPLDLSLYRDPPGPGQAWVAHPSIDRARPAVLFLSRLHEKKGIDRLIRASALLHRRGVEHQFLIAGTGDPRYTDSLRRLVRDEGIGEHTRFLGFVAGRTKVSLFQASALLALPTSQENFGFVFFEALAAGTPVVTTRGADTWPELIESGAGILADNTPEAFTDAIAEALADPDTLRKRGADGRAWALDHCDRARTAAAYRAMYAGCLGEPARDDRAGRIRRVAAEPGP